LGYPGAAEEEHTMSDRKQEDEYFARQDAAKLAKLRASALADKMGEELDNLKDLHFHRCGHCGGAMHTKPFRGVEIEVCDDCGSVLLDQGELEKLSGQDESGMLSGILSLFGG
jgi:hypothetical protein